MARKVGRLLDLCVRQAGEHERASVAAVLRSFLLFFVAGCLTVLPMAMALTSAIHDIVPVVCLVAAVPVLGLGWLAAGMNPSRLSALVALASPAAFATGIGFAPEAGPVLFPLSAVASLALAHVVGLTAAVALMPLTLPTAMFAGSAASVMSGHVGLSFGLSTLAITAAVFALKTPKPAAPQMKPQPDAADASWEALAVSGLLARCSADGLIEAVSGSIATAMDGGGANLLGGRIIERIHVPDRVAWLQALDAVHAGARAATCEVRFRLSPDHAPADQIRLSSMRARIVTAGAGCFAVSFTDIGREKELEQMLSGAREEAETLEIGKDRFLAAVSHELRTPLNAIIGFSDILMREMFGTFSDPRQKEYATLINESGAHLLGVVNTMLDVSKLAAGHYDLLPEHFAIKEIVDDCTSMLALHASRKNVHLADRVPRAMPDVYADRRALKQIIINLLTNAIKFTDAGGCVTIDVTSAPDGFVISVADTGIGMTPDEVRRIGRPFVQIENSYTRTSEGTGLGLSLVSGLAELHGGKLRITSERGKGTIASVFIPRKPAGTIVQATAMAESTKVFEDHHGAARRA